MRVIKPIAFEESHIVSSNVVETYLEWSVSTTYTLDAIVWYGTRLWKSAAGGHTGVVPGTDATKWVDIGPRNKFAMFDSEVQTQTSVPTGDMQVVLYPNKIFNSLALMNIQGNTLRIRVQDDYPVGNLLLDTGVVSLDNTLMSDWYDYFFEEYDFKSYFTLTDIPPYSTARIIIDLDSTSEVKVGHVVYGNYYNLGLTQYGAAFGIKDFSVKDTDDFGITTFTPRAFSKRADLQLWIENYNLTKVTKILSDLRATPSVWIGSTETNTNEVLTVFGFYREFETTISYPSVSMCRLSIEGLI